MNEIEQMLPQYFGNIDMVTDISDALIKLGSKYDHIFLTTHVSLIGSAEQEKSIAIKVRKDYDKNPIHYWRNLIPTIRNSNIINKTTPLTIILEDTTENQMMKGDLFIMGASDAIYVPSKTSLQDIIKSMKIS
jgi:hypothetical protein